MIPDAELNRIIDAFTAKLVPRLKAALCEPCKDGGDRRVPRKNNWLDLPASSGATSPGKAEIRVSGPSYGIFETAEATTIPTGEVLVIPGQTSPDSVQNSTVATFENPGTTRNGLDLCFPRAGLYTILNYSSTKHRINIVEAPESPADFMLRGGMWIPAMSAATAGAAAAIVAAANPKRKFLLIFCSDNTATDVASIGTRNIITATFGFHIGSSIHATSIPRFVSFGPGGTFPLYTGPIYGIRTGAADVSLTVFDCS